MTDDQSHVPAEIDQFLILVLRGFFFSVKLAIEDGSECILGTLVHEFLGILDRDEDVLGRNPVLLSEHVLHVDGIDVRKKMGDKMNGGLLTVDTCQFEHA